MSNTNQIKSEEIITEKICSKCKKSKELNEFGKRSASKDKKQSYCKSCFKEIAVVWNDKNPGKKNAVACLWQKENREKHNDKVKKFQKQPENLIKNNARNFMKGRVPIIEGFCRHHFSYLEENWLNIIYIATSKHIWFHTLLTYDIENRCYRVKDTNKLLDSKRKHLNFLKLYLTETEYINYTHEVK